MSGRVLRKRKVKEDNTTKEPKNVEEQSSKKAKTIQVDGPDPAGEDLIKLLGFDPDTIKSKEDYAALFDGIAKTLMNNYTMVINGKPYRFADIEFYFKGGEHKDHFTHCDELQQTCGKWYFHKTGKGYKGGSYKGLDITFGKEGKGFGGILIRSIESLDGKNFVDGPSTVVDTILNAADASSVPDFADKDPGFDLSVTNKSKLYVAPAKDLSFIEPVKCARWGLTLNKHDNNQEDYILKEYRFITLPSKVKKGKVFTILALHKQGKTVEEIVTLTKTGKQFVAGYISSFNNEKSKQAKDFFGTGLKSVDDKCQLYGALSK